MEGRINTLEFNLLIVKLNGFGVSFVHYYFHARMGQTNTVVSCCFYSWIPCLLQAFTCFSSKEFISHLQRCEESGLFVGKGVNSTS